MDNEKLVNVNKVAKNILAIGRFGLFQIEDLNLLVTDWFMLNVNDDQFWKIQCKLEARQKNVWLFKSKDGLQECTGASESQIYDMYASLIGESRRKLTKTWLIFGHIEIFTDDTKYIGLPVKNLEMIDYTPTVEMAPGRQSVIVDDIHVFTVVEGKNIECKYLRPLADLGKGA